MANDNSQNDRNRGDYRSGRDEAVDARDINRMAEDAFKKGADALRQAEPGKTAKFMGMEMDAGLAGWLDSSYNVIAGMVSTALLPKAYGNITKYGPTFGIRNEKVLQKTAAVAAFGVTFGLKAGKDISQIVNSMSDQRKKRLEFLKQAAPVLDEIKGKHSLGALYSSGNEVLDSHRRRLNKIEHTVNTNNFLSLLANAGPNIAMDGRYLNDMWHHGLSSAEALKKQKLEMANQKTMAQTGQLEGADQAKYLGQALLNTTTGQLSSHLKQSGLYNLRKTLQPYDAFQMIYELSEQDTRKSNSFQVPKNFAADSGRRESFPLEEYVMRIFIQHQKDMASVKEDHTEIRDALKGDLAAVAKPIAQAIRAGDINVMSLVQLVGSGKIIKNHGRAIAGAEEVQDLLKEFETKQAVSLHGDPKTYYPNSTLNESDVKHLLKTLEGEDKMMFAAWIPNEILEHAGMGKQDIKEVETFRLESANKHLAYAIAGLQAKSDEEYKKEGKPQSEINQLRSTYKHLEEGGLQALHDMQSNLAQEQSIEQLVVNFVGPQIQGDKKYLGTLMDSGKTLFEEATAAKETHAERAIKQRGGHTNADLAVAEGFGDREMRRNSHAKGQHFERE